MRKAVVADWVTAAEARGLLDVKPQTLYAYVSRGLIRSIDAGKGGRERLYRREDVERLRARSQARAGHAPVAAAALRWGEPVLDTSIGTVDERGPIYRGRAAVELVAGGSTFEHACALLWTTGFSISELEPPPWPELHALLPRRATPFDAMLITAGWLAAGTPPSTDADIAATSRLVRTLVAACALPRGAASAAEALRVPTVARALLCALGGEESGARVTAVDAALILCADHELNVSTFVTRIAASAGASASACVLAGLAALSGPRHGGATAAVEALVREVATPERAAAVIGEYRDRGEAVPGFGHPLYPAGDPRGALLLQRALEIAPRTRGVRVLVAAVNAMKLAEGDAPTLDIGLVALAAALGLPRGAPLALFACGRLAGWIAHVLEQRRDGHLLRPRARYVGEER